MQTSMNRVVALKMLLPEFQQDETAVQTFLAEASAKANVQHPSILAVYEAGHNDGVYYYAREFVDGVSLTELRTEGRTLDDVSALRLVKVAAEALSYLNQQKIAHPPLTSDDLFLGRDGQPHLNNIATLPEVKSPPAQSGYPRALADRLRLSALTDGRHAGTAIAPRSHASGRQRRFHELGGAAPGRSKTQEPKVVPQDAFKLSAQDAVAIAAVNAAKRRQKRALILTTVGMFGLFWVIAAVVYLKFFRVPPARVFDRMVEIPAGPFTYGDGQQVILKQYLDRRIRSNRRSVRAVSRGP